MRPFSLPWKFQLPASAFEPVPPSYARSFGLTRDGGFSERLFRERLQWTEDTITAGLLARLPVSHVRTTLLEDGAERDDVVLAGGHVFASRVVARAVAEDWP